MTAQVLPRYPIYIPSKGRYDDCRTAKILAADDVPFHLVVEPQEYDHYRAHFPDASILTLPFSDRGSVIPARNWIKEHATAAGYERHWQLDDNIFYFKRRWKERRIPCSAGVALAAVEDFSDRYENVAISGLNYEMFIIPGNKIPPFHLNARVYSCCLILNSIPHRWRGTYNEDADLCLQVLAAGWCTVLFNAFFVWKQWTMRMKGGNTDEIYHGDGRLKMARSLERLWPGVVETRRRYSRPQHVVKDSWRRFDTPLKLKPTVDLSNMGSNEYGMRLVQVNEIKSDELREVAQQFPQAELSEGS